MVSQEAYRTLTINNGLKEGNFKVLFDTGAQVNIISELHPILENARFIQRGPLKINGAFSQNEIFVSEIVLLDLYCINHDERIELGKRLKFWVVPNMTNFGIIMGIKTIKNLNIMVGREICIRTKSGDVKITNSDVKRFHDYGYSADGSIRNYYVDYEYTGDILALQVNDQDYLINGNILSVPNNRFIDVEQGELWVGTKINYDEPVKTLSEVFINKVVETNEKAVLPELKPENVKIGKNLEKDEKQAVFDLLYQYKDIFSKGGYDIGSNKSGFTIFLDISPARLCYSL